MKKFFLLPLLLLIPCRLFAAGAYLVDDGGIVDSKEVQIENWYSRSTTGEDIYVTNPTYQLLPNAEFAIQETYDANSQNVNSLWPQVKYLWNKSDDISSATTVGINYSSVNDQIYGAYVYSSNTLKINDILDLHLYLGWQNWRNALRNDKSTDFLNYGVGADLKLSSKFSFIPEIFYPNGTFKNADTRPATQFGLRHLTNDHIVLDLIYGHNINGNHQNWMTCGVTVMF